MSIITCKFCYKNFRQPYPTCRSDSEANICENWHNARYLGTAEEVNHPSHYGGESNPYETIKVIEAWELGFNLGNALKYLSRAYKKGDSPAHTAKDLEKAIWYLSRELTRLKKMPYFAGVSKSAFPQFSWPEGSVEQKTQSSEEPTDSASPGTSREKKEASSQGKAPEIKITIRDGNKTTEYNGSLESVLIGEANY